MYPGHNRRIAVYDLELEWQVDNNYEERKPYEERHPCLELDIVTWHAVTHKQTHIIAGPVGLFDATERGNIGFVCSLD